MIEIIASIAGAIVTGVFSLVAIKVKRCNDEKKAEKAKEEQILHDRPRLEIEECFEIDKYTTSSKANESLIVATIEEFDNGQFIYDDEILNEEKWASVEYILKNIGSTEIDHMYFSTNYVKSTSIFDNLSNLERSFPEKNILSYSVFSEKKLKPGETIRLQVIFLDEKIVGSPSHALITVWLVDINGCWWSQSLFAPHNKIDNSIKTTKKEWKENTDELKATKCFHNPNLW